MKSNQTYIYKVSNSYTIRKSVDGKLTNFGTYPDIESAIKVRDELIQHNWSTKNIKDHRIKNEKTKYIYKTKSNKYNINKRVNGKQKHFGTYSTLQEAIKVRDELIQNKWSKTYTPVINTNPLRHIIKTKNGIYKIFKTINGKLEYFNEFKKLEDAITERNLLEYYNWDYETLIYNEYDQHLLQHKIKNRELGLKWI